MERWTNADRTRKFCGISHSTPYSAFTLIELLVVIAIIAVVAAILFPVFGRVRENARGSDCLSNLRQIGIAMEMYVHDNDDSYPMSRFPDATHPPGGCTSRPGINQPEDALEGSSKNWKRAIASYLKNQAVWGCPSNTHQWDEGGYNGKANRGDESNVFYPESEGIPISYALNGSFFHEAIPPCWLGEPVVRGRRQSEISAPSQLLLLMESRLSYPDLGDWWLSRPGPGNPPNRKMYGPFQTHNGVANWLMADLHVTHLKPQATCRDRLWTDGLPSKTGGCDQVNDIAEEYR